MEHQPPGGTNPSERAGGAGGGSDALLVSNLRHSVANSLQMLAGLMQVRLTVVGDPGARLELGELVSRVYGMATVYRALELRDSGVHVAVHRVLNDLCDIHRQPPRAPDIQLRCHVGELTMPLDAAMTLTVLTSEIIAAAVQRDRSIGGGVIDVRLFQEEQEHIRLEVFDDGFDLPPSPEKDPGGSLGWNAVSAMARQIGATLERSADDRRIALILTPERRG